MMMDNTPPGEKSLDSEMMTTTMTPRPMQSSIAAAARQAAVSVRTRSTSKDRLLPVYQVEVDEEVGGRCDWQYVWAEVR